MAPGNDEGACSWEKWCAILKFLVLNPSSSITNNVIRDVLYGCWCKGKRIGGASVPPSTLLLVATVLKQAGLDVAFLDALGERISLRESLARASGFDVVIISTSTMSINEDTNVLACLKEANPAIRSIVFGSHPTFMPEATLSRKGVDIIVRREPEFIIRDIALSFERKRNWKEIKGIGYLDRDKIILNPYYPLIENLDELPFIDVDLLPKGIDYFNPIVKRMPYMTITTSRGCPAGCRFCTAPYFYGAKARYRSVESILEELLMLKSKGYREIYFRDETFTMRQDETLKLCKRMIEENLGLSWICNARVDTVNRELLKAMKRAGCHLIKFGVESGVQKILDLSRKGIRVEQTREAFRLTKEVGIDTHAHTMLGMPGETDETIAKTIDFVLEIEPTTVTFGICTPYPGTPMFLDVVKKFPEIQDGSSSDLSKVHVQGLFNEIFTSVKRRDLEKSIKFAYRRFYLRTSYLFKRIKRIENMENLKRCLIGGINVIDFAVRGE